MDSMQICKQTTVQNQTNHTQKTYPDQKTSASFRKAVLIKTGNGNWLISCGNFMIASHCSPTLLERSPAQAKEISTNIHEEI